MMSGSPVNATLDDRELLRRYHEGGDASAREALVQRHLPLVRSLARRYAGRGESLEDIEQVGAIGLIKAIDRYELSREVALTTYATPNIVGEIKRHFRDKGWAIRVPRALQELNGKMGPTIERLTARLGRSPSIAEIAAGVPDHAGAGARGDGGGLGVRAAVAVRRAPTATPSSTRWRRSAPEDVEFERTDERTSLEPALAPLPDREQLILKLRFEEGLTQTQIAEKIGISQMHVSRLIRRSLERMRAQLT